MDRWCRHTKCGVGPAPALLHVRLAWVGSADAARAHRTRERCRIGMGGETGEAGKVAATWVGNYFNGGIEAGVTTAITRWESSSP